MLKRISIAALLLALSPLWLPLVLVASVLVVLMPPKADEEKQEG